MVEYEGAIIMEVDGREVEITKFDVTENTGKKRVKTMNKTARLRGFTRGIADLDLSVTAVKPTDGNDIDWANIEGAKITCYPVGGGKRTSYLDCVTETVGASYTVDNEAVIDIKMFAHRKVEE